jgi:hypothetical protein
MQVLDDGDNWKLVVSDRVAVENIVNWNSSQDGKPSGYKAAIGYDPTPPAGTKIAYMLFPKREWTKAELESPTYQEWLSKTVKKCNVCATIDALRQEQEVGQIPTTSKQSNPTAVQISAGEFIQPVWVAKAAEVGKKACCTKLGEVGTSLIGSVLFDIFSGWATDPGQKQAMKQISNQMMDIELEPEDIPKIREDALNMYEAYNKGGIGTAVKKGFFKSFSDAVNDGLGVEMETRTVRRIGVRQGIAVRGSNSMAE